LINFIIIKTLRLKVGNLNPKKFLDFKLFTLTTFQSPIAKAQGINYLKASPDKNNLQISW